MRVISNNRNYLIHAGQITFTYRKLIMSACTVESAKRLLSEHRIIYQKTRSNVLGELDPLAVFDGNSNVLFANWKIFET